MKKTLFALVLFLCINMTVYAEGMSIASNAGILVERTTGTVLFEQNADAKLPMASVTKIMTMLLGIEAVDSGKISLDDVVIVSEKASSMTGSRVYLSTNEKISVSDLFKSIAVSSGNDAAMCMAEYIGGSEENFVKMMNKRAQELGLKNTHFMNCCGLDIDNHYSSARDLSVLSRELLSHKSIRKFLTIWMDTIRNGTFTLANTNKLVRFYDGCTGVKTGFTSKAMYCVSASATRDGMELIAIILGGPNSKQRFADASGLLNYGFANFTAVKCVSKGDVFGEIPVDKGTDGYVRLVASQDFNIVTSKDNVGEVTKTVTASDFAKAPVKKGETLGQVTFLMNKKEVGCVSLIAEKDVEKCGLLQMFNYMIRQWITF